MLDIILLAMLAGFIILRLRSELGKKTGNEPLPPAAPRAPSGDGRAPAQADHVTDARDHDSNVIDMEEDPAIRRGYQDIRRADHSFDVPTFMEGAQAAYEMILEAFWSGDRSTLKEFLDDSVYSQFSSALDAREANGYRVENKLIEIDKAEVIKAQLSGRMAEITVHFTAELIAVTKDKDGNLIEGDLSDAVEVNDRWTFARDTKSRDPNWLLVATRAG